MTCVRDSTREGAAMPVSFGNGLGAITGICCAVEGAKSG